MSEQVAFIRAIVANPDDDTVRLAYADWLDDQESVRMNCKACNGTGEVMTSDKHGYMDYAMQCRKCEDRTVLDTSNADRAELIRIQIERVHSGNALHGAEITSAILNRHPEWSQVKCPMLDHGPTVLCSVCRSTANLLAWWGERDTNLGIPIPDIQPRPIHWSRGFIEVVEARSEEVWESRRIPCPACTGICDPSVCESCEGSGLTEDERTVPTPWARTIVTAIPTLREIRLVDVPFMAPGRNEFTLRRNGGTLPQPVEDAIYGHDTSSPEAALSAMGRATVYWLRSQ